MGIRESTVGPDHLSSHCGEILFLWIMHISASISPFLEKTFLILLETCFLQKFVFISSDYLLCCVEIIYFLSDSPLEAKY